MIPSKIQLWKDGIIKLPDISIVTARQRRYAALRLAVFEDVVAGAGFGTLQVVFDLDA